MRRLDLTLDMVFVMVNNTVTDISLDRAKIENLIERMNSNELSPLHMMDIIEDFLAEDSNFFSCN